MKTTLIWDLDNLSFKKIEEVNSKLMFKPSEAYALSNKNIKESKIEKIESYGFDFIKIEKRTDILEFLKATLEHTDNYIIVSSDSMFCEFTKIAVEQNKHIQQFLISTKQKRTLFKNDISVNNIKYFSLEEESKINITENKAVEKIDYCQLSNKQIKLKMYAEKVDCSNLSNMEINRKRYAEKVDYSKHAIEKYREQKNKEQGIKYKTQKEKVKGSSSKISLTDLEELYKTTSSLKRELKTKKNTGASK